MSPKLVLAAALLTSACTHDHWPPTPAPTAARIWRLTSNHDITLTYINQMFRGQAGCNQYSAAVIRGAWVNGNAAEVDALSVGIINSTRRKCSEPRTRDEATFFSQLHSGKAIHSSAEQISIDYDDAGVSGTLVFEPAP